MIIKQFRLYPDCHWVYFDVIIHHNRKSLMAATGEEGTVVGLCKGWLTGHVPSGRIKPKIGEIHLFAKRTGIGITSHEICHAVHRYFSIRNDLKIGYGLTLHKTDGGRYASHKEESFCWVLGEMVRQFCVNFHRKRGQEQILKQTTIRPIKASMRCAAFQ